MLASQFNFKEVIGDFPVFDRERLSYNYTKIVNEVFPAKYESIKYSGISYVNVTLTAEEAVKYKQCVKNAARDRDQKGNRFWATQELRRTHHTIHI